jgi:hypothetical protein
MEQEVWHNNKNDTPREGQAPLVMPQQIPACEATSGIMIGGPVVVLHLMGVEEECFMQASFSYRRAV